MSLYCLGLMLGVPYMRARYFGVDLVQRLGLENALIERLFGAGGVWEC